MNKLIVFYRQAKKEYELDDELCNSILHSMKEHFVGWIIDFVDEDIDDYSKMIIIAQLDNELILLSHNNETEVVKQMISISRQVKIQKLLN